MGGYAIIPLVCGSKYDTHNVKYFCKYVYGTKCCCEKSFVVRFGGLWLINQNFILVKTCLL